MKAEIHPTYYADTLIACACGNKMHIGSTKKSIEIEICAHCHPFYTGKEKLIDSAGRVDKFRKRVAKAAPASKKRNPKVRK
ncbi:MAG: 50S ribosomal protein L31 [Patescibacteria group bacterium]